MSLMGKYRPRLSGGCSLGVGSTIYRSHIRTTHRMGKNGEVWRRRKICDIT